jgi:hypothetical protein
MHLFVNVEVPAHVMVIVGWVFMGITSFNIATNMVVLIVSKIYGAITNHLHGKA